MLEAPER